MLFFRVVIFWAICEFGAKRSFEDRVECIYNDSSIEDAPPWFNPCVYEFIQATPDVFNVCGNVNDDPCSYPDNVVLDPWLFGVPTNAIGCEPAYDGSGYAGLFAYGFNPDTIDGWREYIAVRLIEPLLAETNYLVHLRVSLAERTAFACSNIEVLFSTDSLMQEFTTYYMNYTPSLARNTGSYITDYDGWTEVAWNYTASGGEEFMYIGNFQPNSLTDTLYVLEQNPDNHYVDFSYYYVDAVEVRVGSIVGITSNEINDIKVFPNPFAGVIDLAGDMAI